MAFESWPDCECKSCNPDKYKKIDKPFGAEHSIFDTKWKKQMRDKD